MREITQSDTPAAFGAEKNPPIFVYDTSGPYTDPAREDRHPLGPAAAARALDRRAQRHRSSSTARPRTYGQERLADPKLATLRFNLHRKPRRAKPGMNVTQMHYARKGIITPEMEFIAIRETQRRDGLPDLVTRQHPGESVRRRDPESDHARVRARRSGARPRDHPEQHQSPGNRADDHRPQLPGEDQREHRQLRAELRHPGRSREDDVVDALGRRHGHGPLDRQAHPRDARMDHAQFAGADRHGADLPGARESRRQGRRAHVGDLSATR